MAFLDMLARDGRILIDNFKLGDTAMSETKQEWITTSEAADIMGIKRDTVAEYCRRYDPSNQDNKIVCQKIGRDWFVLRESAEAFEPDDKNRGRPSSD